MYTTKRLEEKHLEKRKYCLRFGPVREVNIRDTMEPKNGALMNTTKRLEEKHLEKIT